MTSLFHNISEKPIIIHIHKFCHSLVSFKFCKTVPS